MRIINLDKRGDEIASVCCVDTDPEEEALEAIENPEELPVTPEEESDDTAEEEDLSEESTEDEGTDDNAEE